jgi:predicted molibdopterin-dependent oxidoreductase YjgC
VKNGAKLYVIDPRVTSTARWAHRHLPLHVGGDIALANAVAHAILEEGLENRAFIEHATEGFDAFREGVRGYAPERVRAWTGVDPALVRELARDFARADRAMICWTLGITEHRNAVENVWSLINLSLLCGQVGRYGAGLNPLRGQNNVQGGGDMGALPHKLPGFQDVEDPVARGAYERAWGATIPPVKGWTLTEMFRAMERDELRALWVIGENPAQSEADALHVRSLLAGLDHLVVQDLFLTRTAEMAHVVLPAAAGFCETDGTVTNSERRVQRVRRALPPPGDARDDLWIVAQMARRLGRDFGEPTARALWDEMRAHSPLHRGMSWDRLESMGGIQWPCPDESHPGSTFLHGRLWEEPLRGPRAPFHPVEHSDPAEPLSAEFPLRLTTGRRLSEYNTGVQSARLASPLTRREALELSPTDFAALGLREGDRVRVVSRRGAVTAPVRADPGLPPGLVFLTLHQPDAVDTNALTIEATDPRAGTAEFKAAAVRVERVDDPARAGTRSISGLLELQPTER